ncbi:MAG: mobilization protein [Eubacterium sp.]|nr:mobilization protein [Eubacterium sp.]MCI5731871.1 mobilization protein [Eubacterium sp.]
MADKIYRRTTQLSDTPKRKDDEKARKRNVIVNFRVSQKEKELIDRRIELSGLKKSDYFIESCLYQKILVKGNIRTSDTMREQLGKIAEILNASEGKDFSDVFSQEDGMTLKTIAEILLEITNKGGAG